ncbi:uncharacterized protein LOC108146728, partial [Drosophila elegans]|uniref:uncharacterized protein LOC108146728 n=1 Tax=Drosophila elegans TaxID=30023 RepID=UPI0007E76104
STSKANVEKCFEVNVSAAGNSSFKLNTQSAASSASRRIKDGPLELSSARLNWNPNLHPNPNADPKASQTNSTPTPILTTVGGASSE